MNFLKSTSSQKFTKTKKIIGIKIYCKCMATRALKKVQYGYHGKNGVFSDHTEHT